jgi:acetate kinase
MKILVANIGSTSFKYRLFETDTMTVVAQGRVERIGQPGSCCPDYDSAIQTCLADVVGEGKALAKLTDLNCVAFKAVHAGPLSGARLVDDELLAAMEEFSFFAPAHNPPYIAAMRAFGHTIPATPLVALLETAFFDKMDEAALTFSVPYEWKQDHGIQRYGFHGASHRAASEGVQQLMGRSDLRHISCHLGGSSSMAAIRNGVAVDTTFGMSPQSGLPHNNRTGDLDVFAVLYVMKKKSLSVDEMARILGSESGLAGVSGTSGDVRDIDEGIAKGDSRCRLALDVMIRSVRNYIGSFYVALGGLDVFTFTGGIGENGADIRERICQGLDILGLKLDAERNRTLSGTALLSAPDSKVQVWMFPADEERVVARAAADLLRPAGRLPAAPMKDAD